ncbi:MAG: M56 family metallopeptidase [Proteobacteria bacterium]|nr:M56 family metallopeptidase [Pseudomonadota bacterium]
MTSFFAMRALLFVGECFAVSVLLPALALLASQLVKQASLRHLLWLAVFGALAVFPVVAIIVPSAIVLEHRNAPPQMVSPQPLETTALSEASPAPAKSVSAFDGPAFDGPAFDWPTFDINDVVRALFIVWCAGAGFVVLRLAVGLMGLRDLRRESVSHALSGDLSNIAPENCELRLSSRDAGPVTWGVLRPVILLPKESLQWRRERLRAVLLHELAHVRRRDSLVQLLSELICALFWPSTLIWIAAHALRREAEIAADDAVIASGIKPSAYAGELVELSSEFQRRALASGVAMAARSSLEARVKSVLAPHRLRKGATSMDAFKIACLGLAATSLLALARPDIVLAQDKPPPAVSAPVVAQALPPPPPPVAQTQDVPPAPPPVTPVSDTPPPPPVMADAPAAPDTPVHDDKHPHRAHIKIHIDRDIDQGAPDAVVTDKGHNHRYVVIDIDRDVDQAEIDAAMARAQEAQAKLAEIQPKIDAELAKVDAMTAKAMKDEEPRIRAALARAQAQMMSAAKFVHMEARLNEHVARALARAKPKLDAAMAKVHVMMKIDHDDNDETPADTPVQQ